MSIDDFHYSQLLIKAIYAVKIAGDAILDVYNSDISVEYKSDNSPLTLADSRSHETIMNYLSVQPFNYLPILSEEGKNIQYAERKDWEYFWLVDPLDGTKEFIKRNGEFTVNIALIYKGRPVLGVINIPVMDTIYFAAEDIGSYKVLDSNILNDDIKIDDLLNKSIKLIVKQDDKPIINNRQASITVIGSRSHKSRELEKLVEGLKNKYKEVKFLSAGSSLKFCFVAEGRADIYPRLGPTMEWDTAAGQAIVEQAGGIVLNLQTSVPLRYNKANLLNPFFVAGKRNLEDLLSHSLLH